jgi:hypothetical protein
MVLPLSENQKNKTYMKKTSKSAPSSVLCPLSSTRSPALPSPAFALRKDLGFWQLTFNGQHAIIKHEQGLHYVAYLFLNPPREPIHALELAIRILACHRQQDGLSEIVDPVTGLPTQLDIDSQFQQRNLGLDQALVMRAVLRQQIQLEAILEDKDTIEPVRAEVHRELTTLYAYQESNSAQVRDSASRCVRAVTMALKRLYNHLAAACLASGQPHEVLRAFANHIFQHLIIPSGRYSGTSRGRRASGVAGRFTYEPPKGVVWHD